MKVEDNKVLENHDNPENKSDQSKIQSVLSSSTELILWPFKQLSFKHLFGQ